MQLNSNLSNPIDILVIVSTLSFLSQMSELNIQNIPLHAQPSKFARVMLCQPNWEQADIKRNEWDLYDLVNVDKAEAWLSQFLAFGLEQQVSLIVLPELSVPACLLPSITRWKFEKPTIIVAGSHNVKSVNGMVARCPVIYAGAEHHIDKIAPSYFEKSIDASKGLTRGSTLKVFTGTQLGTLVISICSDFIDPDVRHQSLKVMPKVLCVIAMATESLPYYERMNLAVHEAHHGMFGLYANSYCPGLFDGASAIFAAMDTNFRKPEGQFPFLQGTISDANALIVELNFECARPTRPNTTVTAPSVRFVTRQILSPNASSTLQNLGDSSHYTRVIMLLEKHTWSFEGLKLVSTDDPSFTLSLRVLRTEQTPAAYSNALGRTCNVLRAEASHASRCFHTFILLANITNQKFLPGPESRNRPPNLLDSLFARALNRVHNISYAMLQRAANINPI